MRLRIDLAYDGSDFRGWARQPGLRTVQGVLEQALGRILGGTPQLVVAGRTDAGVHASGQVAHLDLDDAQQRRLASGRTGTAQSLAHRVNGVLGAYPDVIVRATQAAPEGFDARFSANSRTYEYRIADGITGYDPLERHRTTSVTGQLNLGTMNEASARLIGLHDFAAYCKPRPEATTIRTLLEFSWRRDSRGVLVARLKADAFCHSMVRALVGACAAVGEGRITPSDVEQIRDGGERSSMHKVLAARGLTLIEVGYPGDDLLAARADQTRARRSLDG